MDASLKREGRQLRLGDVKRSCAGGRTIDLPPAFLGRLREHRSSQVRERPVAGPAWIDGGYVFASKFGTPLDNDATIEEVAHLLSDNPTTSYQPYRHRLRASAGAPSPRSSASSGRRMAAAAEFGGQPALVAATQQRSRGLTRGFSVGRTHPYSNSPDVRERVLTVVRIAAETGHTVERCYQNVIA